MKEIKLISNTKLVALAIVVSSIVISGSGLIAITLYNKTQWDISEAQMQSSREASKATVEASREIKQGLDLLGGDICRGTRANVFTIC